MKPSAQTSFAERFGQMLGRMRRGYLRQERKVNGWFVERGVPAGGATALLWIVKLVVLGVLLYVAFWLALVLVFAVVAASAVGGKPSGEDEPEWRIGLSGYGLYRGDTRIDPGSPDDD
ncbi:DUF3742 family protein [Pseudomonas reactans]|uniref:DUF3742 family protein n=1 Tax=Pseudomonas reactans TaxID=117680 RepID=A0A7Y8KLI7_9PSED|nr:DUF3742 family protein [Pseudomonas reactans]NWE92410.1 DUF3742 family protein [Pseudomonas reactans]